MCHPRFGKQTIPHFSWMEEGPHIKEWGLGKVQLNLREGGNISFEKSFCLRIHGHDQFKSPLPHTLIYN